MQMGRAAAKDKGDKIKNKRKAGTDLNMWLLPLLATGMTVHLTL